MKSAGFEYYRVDTAEEALARLTELGDDAKLLAGGQSLVPMMNLRIARPAALIDISRISALRYLRQEDDLLRVGALTPHAALERADGLAESHTVLRRAASWIGHLPIRMRGTFGGSVAHADPTAEWCVLAVALDAHIAVMRLGAEREIAAGDFFGGFMTTALEPDEMVFEVRFPDRPRHSAMQEFAQRSGDFAVVVVAVSLELDQDLCRSARVVIGGVDAVPVRIRDSEEALVGTTADPTARDEAARLASERIDPHSDSAGSAEYRRHLTAILTRRALSDALAGDPLGPP